MDAKQIIGAALLIALFPWAAVADDPAGVFINGQPVGCQCAACDCFTCLCKTGECRCAGCSDRKPAVAEPPLQIIRFTADWCSPCRQMAPAWSRVAAENPGLMSELDLDENGPLARQWGVTAIPCVVVVRDGKLLTRYRAGVLSEGQLRAIVQRWK